jgi:cytochrome c5
MRLRPSRWSLALCLAGCSHAYTPAGDRVIADGDRHPAPVYDLWGRAISASEAKELEAAQPGALSPGQGAVRIDGDLLLRGERAFYEETFGNEHFLTDVLGMLDGPLGPSSFARAIAGLHGQATTDLRVPLGADVVVGGQTFAKGQLIDTGLDVAKGAREPLGMEITVGPGGVRAGITCALCHSTVDPATGLVVHGAPNADLAAGILLAMASNSAAYFLHTGVDPRNVRATDHRIAGKDGQLHPLPDARALEDAVDADLLAWPPGNFDSMTDLVNAPAQIPTSFTWQAGPFSWSGAFMAGPFRGLSTQNNNVHALNADALTEADAVPARFGLDSELFLAIVLQNAADRDLRVDLDKTGAPGQLRAFFDAHDPTPGQPAMNQVVALPSYPRATLIEPTSLMCSVPGRPFWEAINAMSAWQDTLRAPPPPAAAPAEQLARGRLVFQRAGCARCHDGPALTNHRIIAVPEIGTQAVRAKAMASTARAWQSQPRIYAFDQQVPLPAAPRTLPVPVADLDPQQIALAYGWPDSPGGYKVPALVGLAVSAPYLHDGGVAVGADRDRKGVAATLLQGIAPDPRESLRALVDRKIRADVVAANRASPRLQRMHVEGTGHAFWVDGGADFTGDDQEALLAFLLAFRP